MNNEIAICFFDVDDKLVRCDYSRANCERIEIQPGETSIRLCVNCPCDKTLGSNIDYNDDSSRDDNSEITNNSDNNDNNNYNNVEGSANMEEENIDNNSSNNSEQDETEVENIVARHARLRRQFIEFDESPRMFGEESNATVSSSSDFH